MHAPLAAPPAQSERLCPAPAEQALMHGLVKGLEGLLGTKPAPPAPRITCRCCAAPADQAGTVAHLVPGQHARSARGASAKDESPRGEVVRLPTRPRKTMFANSANRLAEPLLARL